VATYFLSGHGAPSNIAEWKGNEIALFQEDLFATVKGRVSEKWFYTYFKNTPSKLPRIDMLNVLSAYVGCENWADFKKQHEHHLGSQKSFAKKYTLVLITTLIVGGFSFFFNQKNEFHFCFIDELTNETISETALDIKVLSSNESPLFFKTDSLGCFSYTTRDQHITFVVKSPYHKTDTIIRTMDHSVNQTIPVAADDYSLMLNYFVTGNVTDWRKHKKRLENLIADDALIYQLHPNSIGIELFDKDEFITMLTIPTTRLHGIKILDKTLREGKIVKLKFMAP